MVIVIVMPASVVINRQTPHDIANPKTPPSAQSKPRFDQKLDHDLTLRCADCFIATRLQSVRSVTLTNMMFMTTMPPTNSVIKVIGITTLAMPLVNSSIWLVSS